MPTLDGTRSSRQQQLPIGVPCWQVLYRAAGIIVTSFRASEQSTVGRCPCSDSVMLTQLQPPAYGTLGPKGLLEFLGNSSRFLSSAPPPHTKLMIGNRSTSLLTINPESAESRGIMTGGQSIWIPDCFWTGFNIFGRCSDRQKGDTRTLGNDQGSIFVVVA